MELIFENWRKALNEAAKEPKDLVNISDKIKDVWIDNLLDEYGLNQLIGFYEIPVSQKFKAYYNKIRRNPTPEQKEQIKNYTVKFKQAMKRHGAGAPKPIIIIARHNEWGNDSYKVSYGGFFTRVKTGTVQVVPFDHGKRADNKIGIKGFPGAQ